MHAWATWTWLVIWFMHDRSYMGGRHHHECVWQDHGQGWQHIHTCRPHVSTHAWCAGVLKTSAPAFMAANMATCMFVSCMQHAHTWLDCIHMGTCMHSFMLCTYDVWFVGSIWLEEKAKKDYYIGNGLLWTGSCLSCCLGQWRVLEGSGC